MGKKSKIFVAGHNGLVGSAVLRLLKLKGYKNIIVKNRKELDLTNQNEVNNFLKKEKPKKIIIAAAKVGGIVANNKYRAEFIYENLSIQTNIIHSAYVNKIKDLVFLGSSCVYPRNCKQPIKEEYLLTGLLEYTNEPYAIAKIAGIKMCENYNKQYKTNYKCLMPCNTYGINDNYDSETSHFFPALIKKIYNHSKKNKKTITLWGTGTPKRELIYVNDLAEACIYFMNKKTNHSLINIGTQREMTIKQYANFIKKKLNIKINIKFDLNKSLDGTPRKILNCSVARSYGWRSKTPLELGFNETFKHFVKKNI
ncbi:MAG: GDP-L-fucose synthase [Candidatus Pelagibacter sp. TMED118]|nr:MAG: GDP-L-fucose synthase [Candidatus Pelagibacter sp. TMED118]|tara:strand:+ start:4316 stop:5248 length:933 start_codon:yes stop_codon:yes gene_type:complete